jgi:hypothetical protein
MAYIFNCDTKIVQLDNTDDLDLQDLYSRWKDQVLSGMLSGCEQFMRVVKEPLVGAVFVGPYYFIMNNWQIRPNNSNYVLDVSGTIIKDEATQTLDPFKLDDLTSTVSVNQLTAIDVQVVESRAPLSPAQDALLSGTLQSTDTRLDNLDATVSGVGDRMFDTNLPRP